MNSSLLDPTTIKLRALCGDELTFIAQHGHFQAQVASESGSFCYSLLRAMAHMANAETQAIEGINSQLKIVSKRCPNISLELLSSRLLIKRHLGTHAGSKKWSSVKPFAEKTLAALTDHTTSSLGVLGDTDRWALASTTMFGHSGTSSSLTQTIGLRASDVASLVAVCGNEICEEQIVPVDGQATSEQPSPRPDITLTAVSSEQIAWAKNYNILWKRNTAPNKRQAKKLAAEMIAPKASLSLAVLHSSARECGEVYIVVEKFAHSVQFSRLRSSTANSQQHVQWVYNENNCVESTLFFMSFYDACMKGETIQFGHCALQGMACEALFHAPGILLQEVEAAAQPIMKLSQSTKTETLHRGGSRPQQTSKDKGRGRSRGRGKGRKQDKARGRTAAPVHDTVPESDSSADGKDKDVKFQHDVSHWDDISDSSTEGTSGLEDPDDDMSGHSAALIKQAQVQGECPSADQVLQQVDELQQSDAFSVVPDAEQQEEALLLILKRSRDENLQLGPASSSSPAVTAASGANRLAVLPAEEDAYSDGDTPPHESIGDFSHQQEQLLKRLNRDPHLVLERCAAKWIRSSLKTLQSTQVFSEHKDKEIGHERSVALVLQKPMFEPIEHCKCVRCKWSDESNQLMFVHWLNNTAKLLGKRSWLWPEAVYMRYRRCTLCVI